MRRHLITVLTATLLVLAAACGDDSSETPTATAPATSPTTEPTTTEPTTTAPADEAEEPEATIRSFMDARLRGEGAEDYLTETGSEIFPGDIALYDLSSYQLISVEAADANSFEVAVSVTDKEGATRTETLFVGPGESLDGTALAFAIRGAVGEQSG
jgi:hypothetical protein